MSRKLKNNRVRLLLSFRNNGSREVKKKQIEVSYELNDSCIVESWKINLLIKIKQG